MATETRMEMLAAEIAAEGSRQPPAERCAFLDQACGESPHLRRTVDAILLRMQRDPNRCSDHLAQVTSPKSPEVDPLQTEQLPDSDIEILALKCRGGQGYVYLAKQRSLGRNVAVKVSRTPMPASASGHLLKTEARLLAGMCHPGIATVHSAGVVDQRPYFVMEWIKGKPITDATSDLSLNDRVDVLIEIADAVAYSHGKGIFHGDISAQNILMEKNESPKVLDFGIATLLDKLDEDGPVRAGTPPYTAPECLKGQRPDARSDIYSLGMVAREILRVSTAAESSHTVEPETSLPADLTAILDKSTAKKPEARYDTMKSFADDLRNFRSFRPVEARAGVPLHHARLWSRRHPGLAACLGALAVIVVAAFLLVNNARQKVANALALAEELIAAQEAALNGLDIDSNPAMDRREAIDAATVEARSVGDPAARGRLLTRCGRMLSRTGDQAAAVAVLADAVQSLRMAPQSRDRDLRLACALNFLAWAKHDHTLADGVSETERRRWLEEAVVCAAEAESLIATHQEHPGQRETYAIYISDHARMLHVVGDDLKAMNSIAKFWAIVHDQSTDWAMRDLPNQVAAVISSSLFAGEPRCAETLRAMIAPLRDGRFARIEQRLPYGLAQLARWFSTKPGMKTLAKVIAIEADHIAGEVLSEGHSDRQRVAAIRSAVTGAMASAEK